MIQDDIVGELGEIYKKICKLEEDVEKMDGFLNTLKCPRAVIDRYNTVVELIKTSNNNKKLLLFGIDMQLKQNL